jgi:hypothetical protein
MIQLLIKNAPNLVIDQIDFQDEFRAAPLFLELIKTYKQSQRIYIRQQNNILATLATVQVIYTDGELSITSPSAQRLMLTDSPPSIYLPSQTTDAENTPKKVA